MRQEGPRPLTSGILAWSWSSPPPLSPCPCKTGPFLWADQLPPNHDWKPRTIVLPPQSHQTEAHLPLNTLLFPSEMAGHRCPGEWVPGSPAIWRSSISGCVWEGACGREQHLSGWVDWVKQRACHCGRALSSPWRVGLEQEGGRGRILSARLAAGAGASAPPCCRKHAR